MDDAAGDRHLTAPLIAESWGVRGRSREAVLQSQETVRRLQETHRQAERIRQEARQLLEARARARRAKT